MFVTGLFHILRSSGQYCVYQAIGDQLVDSFN